jgi:hypothetical protein
MAMACGALAVACASTSIALVHSTSVLAAGMFADHGAQRQRAADATIGELEAQRTSYLSYLAARCHLSQAALDTLLADALQSKSLPRFAAEVPREPPVAVTLDRNDQVAGALQNLRMHSDIANTAYARVVDARTDFEASKQSRDRGDISEVQLMEGSRACCSTCTCWPRPTTSWPWRGWSSLATRKACATTPPSTQ